MSLNKIKSLIVKILRQYGLKPPPPPALPSVISDERLEKIKVLSKLPLKEDGEIRRVEICILKYKEDPKVIDPAVTAIIHNTQWPFKLTVFDNRPNPANMAKIWNKIIHESTCDYICFIDSDAYVPNFSPCWLTRMMESIETKGIVVPYGDNVTGINRAKGPKNYPSSSVQEGVWTGFCFLIKKDLGLQLPFDENFYIYGQDSEWAKRFSDEFGGVVIREDVLVNHLRHYSTKKAQRNNEIDKDADMEYSRRLIEGKFK